MNPQYHQPEDDWELLDPAGAARILTMFRQVVCELASTNEGPTFQESVAAPGTEDDPLKTDTEPKQATTTQADSSPARGADEEEGEAPQTQPAPPTQPAEAPAVRLDILADPSPTADPGVIVKGIVDGGAAQRAGIRTGDRIVRIGEDKVDDVYAYLAAMRKQTAGKAVNVTVLREGKEVTVAVTPSAGARRSRAEE
jgi:membrane-associated protease RseP (regulator of RpoE activity)